MKKNMKRGALHLDLVTIRTIASVQNVSAEDMKLVVGGTVIAPSNPTSRNISCVCA